MHLQQNGKPKKSGNAHILETLWERQKIFCMDQYCTETITNRAFGASGTHLTTPPPPNPTTLHLQLDCRGCILLSDYVMPCVGFGLVDPSRLLPIYKPGSFMIGLLSEGHGCFPSYFQKEKSCCLWKRMKNIGLLSLFGQLVVYIICFWSIVTKVFWRDINA